YAVEEILLNNGKTKLYVPHLKDGYLFCDKIRKRIFRTLVRHICFKDVDHPTKVTGNMKEGLAKSIVVAFPQYQKLVPVPGQTPWSHIVSNVQNIFKRILSSLPAEERPRKGKKFSKTKQSLTNSSVNVELLAVTNPDKAHREEILDGMRKTFQLRVVERRKGDSITEMIQRWPHLRNYHGEVLSLEFELLHPKAVDMVRVLTPLVPKILDKFSSVKSLSSKCGLDEMKVLMYLGSRLPHTINKDASPIPVEKEIVKVVKIGKSVEEFVEENRSKSNSAVQPYLIAVKGCVSVDILKYFLVLDSFTMELGKIPFLRAIDWLFKSYHVFNVHYPLSWKNFFRFLQTCIYKVFTGTQDDVIPSAQNLYSMLLSL
ncbi:Phenylalanine--tRNA ligase alpha subunit, partial [Frankliniella fusca]